VHFEEIEVVGGEEGKKRKMEEHNGEKMERDVKEKIGIEKEEWGNRGLRELVLGQNGERSW
jgi:hypothetical protein